MVSDMVAHRESVMRNRLAGETYPVPQTQPRRTVAEYENAAAADADADDDQRDRQNLHAKTINKEVCTGPKLLVVGLNELFLI